MAASESASSCISHVPSVRAVVLAVWARSVSPLWGRLSANIVREVSSYVPPTVLLCGVQGDRALVYNLLEGTCAVRDCPAVLAREPACCVLDQVTIACLGGHPATRTAAVLSLLTLAAERLPDMRHARELPGLCRHSSALYVFGGYAATYLKSCETLQLGATEWTALPDMHRPRCAFPPCVFLDDIYLPCATGYLEVFSVSRQLFRGVPIYSDTLVRQSISFVVEDELHVLTSECDLGRLKLPSQEAQFALSKVDCSVDDFALSSCVAVQFNSAVYWVTRAGALAQYREAVVTVS